MSTLTISHSCSIKRRLNNSDKRVYLGAVMIRLGQWISGLWQVRWACREYSLASTSPHLPQVRAPRVVALDEWRYHQGRHPQRYGVDEARRYRRSTELLRNPRRTSPEWKDIFRLPRIPPCAAMDTQAQSGGPPTSPAEPVLVSRAPNTDRVNLSRQKDCLSVMPLSSSQWLSP
jgi:hypothetical protein